MTRRNDKRSNRRNRQRNNTPELPPFAQMLFGALLGKGVDMIAKKMAEIAEEETPDIHAEGISNQDVTNINNGKATLSKLRIPADGSAVEYPIPDKLQFFFNEEGKLMVRKKIEGDEEKIHDVGNGVREAIREPITYDDILKEFYLDKTAYWGCDEDDINEGKQGLTNYKDAVNCTTPSQAKRCIAFNKLQNIAKYLNKGWEPNFDDTLQEKFYISYTGDEPESDFPVDLLKSYQVCCKVDEPVYESLIYFKTCKLAYEAIRIMGKDSLNDLFSTDW